MYDPHIEAFDDILAARYSLGVADISEIDIAERRLVLDEVFADRVADYDVLFSEWDVEVAPQSPPADLWQRIESAIDDLEKSPNTRTIKMAERQWEPFVPGIARKVLHADKAAASQIVMYKVDPGTELDPHSHILPEECLVLDGEIEVDGVTIGTGDVHIALAGTRHGRIVSRTGALLYVRADLHMQP